MTDTQLKPCPFCGAAGVKSRHGYYTCSNDYCNLVTMSNGWNYRPIEDALQARIAELEAKLDAYAERERWHKYPDKKPWAGGEWLILLDGVEKIAVWTYGRFEIQSEEYPTNNNLISHWRELPTPPEEQ